MKISLSYGHDSNAPLIEKIKEYLSKDAEGNLKHEAWINTSEIKVGRDCREKITEGVLESNVVLAGLSVDKNFNVVSMSREKEVKKNPI